MAPDQVEKLDWDTLESYWLAITQIEAQEALIQLRISNYAYLKKEDQRKTHRQFHKLAYPKTHSGEKVSLDEMALRLKAMTHGE